MRRITSVCVFCGSSSGSEAIYTFKARALGQLLAREGITLVYGGSNVGLMREIADTMMVSGGKVIGVMPHNLIEREVAHKGISEFRVVNTMSERKAVMNDLSDAFIAMPGGIGTLDELFEVMSWNQLEIIDKPLALFNIKGYYNHLVHFLDYAVNQRFVKPEHRQNLICENDEVLMLRKMTEYAPAKVDGGKWINELRKNTYL